MHADSGGRQYGGYYAVLGDIASEDDEDINMEERQSNVVSGTDTWAQGGDQDGDQGTDSRDEQTCRLHDLGQDEGSAWERQLGINGRRG